MVSVDETDGTLVMTVVMAGLHSGDGAKKMAITHFIFFILVAKKLLNPLFLRPGDIECHRFQL